VGRGVAAFPADLVAPLHQHPAVRPDENRAEGEAAGRGRLARDAEGAP
jgi:hypothetical protein